ncbi:MAG: SpoVG family protein [Candidatus Eisenbacteria bacterium]|nr:SpoVG family protein [Candidatus Eisenbacteria bacterium]
MQITEIRIALRSDDKLKAFVSVTFDDAFVVRGMKIIEGKDGHLFVAIPSRKKPDGTYQDVAHPINVDFRQFLEDQIIIEYEKEKMNQPA